MISTWTLAKICIQVIYFFLPLNWVFLTLSIIHTSYDWIYACSQRGCYFSALAYEMCTHQIVRSYWLELFELRYTNQLLDIDLLFNLRISYLEEWKQSMYMGDGSNEDLNSDVNMDFFCQFQLNKAAAPEENLLSCKRLADGSKRIRVPPLVNSLVSQNFSLFVYSGLNTKVVLKTHNNIHTFTFCLNCVLMVINKFISIFILYYHKKSYFLAKMSCSINVMLTSRSEVQFSTSHINPISLHKRSPMFKVMWYNFFINWSIHMFGFMNPINIQTYAWRGCTHTNDQIYTSL